MAGDSPSLRRRERDVTTAFQKSEIPERAVPSQAASSLGPSALGPLEAPTVARGIHCLPNLLLETPPSAIDAAPYLQDLCAGGSFPGAPIRTFCASEVHSPCRDEPSPRTPNGGPASGAPNGCHTSQAAIIASPPVTGFTQQSHPSAARSYLQALLTPAPVPIRTADGTKLRRARSLPALHNQCFRCLATDHHVEACRDPVRCRQCLRYGHRSASCTMAGPSAFWARVAQRATFSSSEDSASPPRPRAPAPPGWGRGGLAIPDHRSARLGDWATPSFNSYPLLVPLPCYYLGATPPSFRQVCRCHTSFCRLSRSPSPTPPRLACRHFFPPHSCCLTCWH